MCVGVLQLIQTVTAVDPDEPLRGHHFYYSLAPEAANNPNFTLRDNQGRDTLRHDRGSASNDHLFSLRMEEEDLPSSDTLKASAPLDQEQ